MVLTFKVKKSFFFPVGFLTRFLNFLGLLLEQNGGGHRIPSGDSVGEGKQWLARLHNMRTNSSIFTSIFETLASPEMARKRQLRLGRWHFYASHLVEGERGEFSLKSDFSADPKFRSRKEIDDNALAPRGDSQVATPSAIRGIPFHSLLFLLLLLLLLKSKLT